MFISVCVLVMPRTLFRRRIWVRGVTIHNVFHVSMLRWYRSDPSHVISPKEVEIQPDMTYDEEPIKILARETKELRNKKVALVKVLWKRHGIEEATWELEETMRSQYPHLFTGTTFEDESP